MKQRPRIYYTAAQKALMWERWRKPWQNGTNESFNGKFRDECLSMEWFRNRLEARGIIEDWRRHYNEIRSHSSLNYLTPRQ